MEILSEIMESMCSRQSFSFSYLSLSQIISFKTSRFVGRRPLGSEEQGFPMRKYSGSGRIFFATTEAMNNDKRPFNGFLKLLINLHEARSNHSSHILSHLDITEVSVDSFQ